MLPHSFLSLSNFISSTFFSYIIFLSQGILLLLSDSSIEKLPRRGHTQCQTPRANTHTYAHGALGCLQDNTPCEKRETLIRNVDTTSFGNICPQLVHVPSKFSFRSIFLLLSAPCHHMDKGCIHEKPCSNVLRARQKSLNMNIKSPIKGERQDMIRRSNPKAEVRRNLFC
jgi:hypothetical protein